MQSAVFFMALVALAAITASCSSDGDDGDAQPTGGAVTGPTPTPTVQQVDGETRIKFYLTSSDGTGQTGHATLTSAGPQTQVDIEISPPSDAAQPIHIHAGTCDDVGTVIESLENVIRGHSDTTVNRSLEQLTSEGVLVNVHTSADDFSSTACGPLFHPG